MHRALTRVRDQADLSRNLTEIISKSLEITA